jgi:hypothetical protein
VLTAHQLWCAIAECAARCACGGASGARGRHQQRQRTGGACARQPPSGERTTTWRSLLLLSDANTHVSAPFVRSAGVAQRHGLSSGSHHRQWYCFATGRPDTLDGGAAVPGCRLPAAIWRPYRPHCSAPRRHTRRVRSLSLPWISQQFRAYIKTSIVHAAMDRQSAAASNLRLVSASA